MYRDHVADPLALADGLPGPVRHAWRTQDVDAVVAWLLSPEHPDGFPPEAGPLALTVAEILLTSEPVVAARLFRTLAARAVTPAERVAVLQRQMDSESRLGRAPEVRAALTAVQAVVDLLDSAEDATAVRTPRPRTSRGSARLLVARTGSPGRPPAPPRQPL